MIIATPKLPHWFAGDIPAGFPGTCGGETTGEQIVRKRILASKGLA
jgi:hypothetical protein